MGYKDKLKSSAIDLSQNMEWLKAVIYGNIGMGKTVLSATTTMLSAELLKKYPALDGDTFFMSGEKGTLSLKNPKFKDRINLKRIKPVSLENFVDFNDYYEFLFLHCELVKKLDAYSKLGDEKKMNTIKDSIWALENDTPRPKGQEPRIYRFAVIDSLTESQKKSMDRILDVKHGAKTEGTLATADIDFDMKAAATLPDYGVNTNQMRKLVRAFRDLDMHVIFTTLEIEIKDDLTGEMVVRPALTEKLAQDVLSYVDIVGRIYTQESKTEKGVYDRKLLVQPFGKYVGKDRTGMLGMGMVDPTFSQIFDKIYGGM